MSTRLLLQAREYQGPTRWRWVLETEDGRFLADHEVQLNGRDWQVEALADLPGYLAWHAAPDRRGQDEAEIVSSLGEWIGTEVLGRLGTEMVARGPATIRLVLPAEPDAVRSLMFLPLELARVRGRTIGLSRINLVRELNRPVRAASRPGDRVRVLGLFSLPHGGQVLNMRRERQALVQTSARIAALGQDVDVCVLQYGVTRDHLRAVLEEDEGWDVIHVFGQSPPGELLLETDEGQPDRVTSEELAAMLDLARERVALVTVSASWSGAQSGAETRRLLGLPAIPGWPSDQVPGSGLTVPDPADAAAGSGDSAFRALLIELAERLECAVLATRYPVTDDFAAAFYNGLYQRLVGKGQPLPEAVGLALNEVAAATSTPAVPVLSLYSPVLLGAGADAATLRLGAPRRVERYSYDIGILKMAGFPSQPDRFVGRTAVMARTSAALAAASGVPGVLLHGMPGAGKTACALELAYTHEHAFNSLVWFKAPEEGQDITGAFTDFALTLERGLPGLHMVHVLADEAKLADLLAQLTVLMKSRRILIVIDNIESLLAASGEWRDDRWGQLTGALCGHTGLGRVVLTSRRPPTHTGPAAGEATLRVEAVDALSLDETLLLARQLPHLRELIDGEMPGLDPDTARRLALRVLNVAQGHPKLLELADGQAGNPDRLAALVQAGDQAWGQAGGLTDEFIRTGDPQAAAQDYLHVLAAWTHKATERLTQGQRTLFWFLCCLEEGDRMRPVLDANLADLWHRLDLTGEPPDLDPAVTALADYGLIAVRRDDGESYTISAGVVAAAHDEAGQAFKDAVDVELAAFWRGIARAAQEREVEQGTTALVVRAGASGLRQPPCSRTLFTGIPPARPPPPCCRSCSTSTRPARCLPPRVPWPRCWR